MGLGSRWESDRNPVGAGREQDEEIGPVQTSTVHHDSETCNVRAVYYCVTVKSRKIARETDRFIMLHCHTD